MTQTVPPPVATQGRTKEKGRTVVILLNVSPQNITYYRQGLSQGDPKMFKTNTFTIIHFQFKPAVSKTISY